MSHTTFKNFFCHFSFQYKQPFYGLFQPAAKVTQYNGNILKQKQYPTYSTKEMSYLTVVLLHNDGFIKLPFKVKNLFTSYAFYTLLTEVTTLIVKICLIPFTSSFIMNYKRFLCKSILSQQEQHYLRKIKSCNLCDC